MQKLIGPALGFTFALTALANCSGGGTTTTGTTTSGGSTTSSTTSGGGSSGTSGTSGGSSGTSGTSGGSSGTSGTSGGSSGTSGGASSGGMSACGNNNVRANAITFTLGTPVSAVACDTEPFWYWKTAAAVAVDETLCLTATGLDAQGAEDVDVLLFRLDDMGVPDPICGSNNAAGSNEQCEGAEPVALTEVWVHAENLGTGSQTFTFNVTRGACPQ